jgi:putative spermidine/putrescine transport system ATP-binding protein
MRGEIRRIHQEFGLTTIYVTHDQEEALSLADRLVVLRDGEVSQVGTPAELYEHPADPHVAAFMGYRNLLRLTAAGGDGAAGRGLTFSGAPAGGRPLAAGEPVTVAVRPEDLRIAAEGEQAVAEVVAEVVEYHGRSVHVQAVTAHGDRLHLTAGQLVCPGDTLSVAVAPGRALIFPGEAP